MVIVIASKTSNVSLMFNFLNSTECHSAHIKPAALLIIRWLLLWSNVGTVYFSTISWQSLFCCWLHNTYNFVLIKMIALSEQTATEHRRQRCVSAFVMLSSLHLLHWNTQTNHFTAINQMSQCFQTMWQMLCPVHYSFAFLCVHYTDSVFNAWTSSRKRNKARKRTKWKEIEETRQTHSPGPPQ